MRAVALAGVCLIAASLVAEVSVQGAEQAAAQLGMVGDAVTRTSVGAAAAGYGMRRVGDGVLGMAKDQLATAMGFDFSMQQIKATIEATTGAQGVSTQALGDKALQMGRDTVFGATEAATGMDQMARAGWNAQQIIGTPGGHDGLIDSVLNFAGATGTDVPQAARIFDGVMRTFQDQGLTSAHVADILTTGTLMSGKSVTELGSAFQYIGPLADNLGVPLAQTTALLSDLEVHGLAARTAGTSLRSGLIALLDPTSKQGAEIDRLGINTKDAAGNFVGMDSIIGQLHDKFAGMTDAQKIASAATIFGKNAVSGWLDLIKGGPAEIDKFTNAIDKQGTAAGVMGTVMDSVQGAVKQFHGSIDTLQVMMGRNFEPAMRFAADAATGLINAFINAPPIFHTVAAALEVVVGGFLALTGAVVIFNALNMGATFATAAEMIGGMLVPIAAVAAGAFLLYEAWNTNFLGIRDLVHSVVDDVTDKFHTWRDEMVALESFGFNPVAAGAIALGNVLEGVFGPNNALSNFLDGFGGFVNNFIGGFQAALDQGVNPFVAGFEALAYAFSRLLGYNNPISLLFAHLARDTYLLSVNWQDLGKVITITGHMVGTTISDMAFEMESLVGKGTALGDMFHTVGRVAGEWSFRFGALRAQGLNPLAAGFEALGAAIQKITGDNALAQWAVRLGVDFTVLGAFWDKFVADLSSGDFTAAVGDITGALSTLGDIAGATFDLLVAGFQAIDWSAVGSAVLDGISTAVSAAMGAVDWGAALSGLLGALTAAAQAAVSGGIALGGVLVDVAEWLRGQWPDIWSWLKGIVDTAGAQAVNLANIAVNVAGWFRGAWPDIWSWLKGIVDTAGAQAVNLANIVVNVAGWARGVWPDMWTWLRSILDTAGAQAVNLANIAVNVANWARGVWPDLWAWLKGIVDTAGAQAVNLANIAVNVAGWAKGAWPDIWVWLKGVVDTAGAQAVNLSSVPVNVLDWGKGLIEASGLGDKIRDWMGQITVALQADNINITMPTELPSTFGEGGKAFADLLVAGLVGIIQGALTINNLLSDANMGPNPFAEFVQGFWDELDHAMNDPLGGGDPYAGGIAGSSLGDRIGEGLTNALKTGVNIAIGKIGEILAPFKNALNQAINGITLGAAGSAAPPASKPVTIPAPSKPGGGDSGGGWWDSIVGAIAGLPTMEVGGGGMGGGTIDQGRIDAILASLGSGGMGAHEPGSGGPGVEKGAGIPLPIYGPPIPKDINGGMAAYAPSARERAAAGGAAGAGAGEGDAIVKSLQDAASKIPGIMAQIGTAIGTGMQAALAGANAFGAGISRVFLTPLQQLAPQATAAMRGVATGIGAGMQAALAGAAAFGPGIARVFLTPLTQLGPRATTAMHAVAVGIGTGMQAALTAAAAFGPGISRVFLTPLTQLGPRATAAMHSVAVGIGAGLQAALTAATTFGAAIARVFMTPLTQLGPRATAAMHSVAVGIGAGLQAALTAATTFGHAIYTVVSTQLGLLVGNTTAMMTALGNAVRTGFAAAQAAATTAATAIYTQVSTSFGQLVGNVTSLMAGLNSNVSSAMSTMSSNMSSAAQSASSAMTAAMGDMAASAEAEVANMVASITGAVQGMAGEMAAAGAAAGQGLADGLNSQVGAVQAAASALASAAASAASQALSVHSPSLVFHRIGTWAGQGLIDGMHATIAGVTHAGHAMAAAAANGAATASQRVYFGLGTLSGLAYTDGLKAMSGAAASAGTSLGNAATGGIGEAWSRLATHNPNHSPHVAMQHLFNDMIDAAHTANGPLRDAMRQMGWKQSEDGTWVGPWFSGTGAGGPDTMTGVQQSMTKLVQTMGGGAAELTAKLKAEGWKQAEDGSWVGPQFSGGSVGASVGGSSGGLGSVAQAHWDAATHSVKFYGAGGTHGGPHPGTGGGAGGGTTTVNINLHMQGSIIGKDGAEEWIRRNVAGEVLGALQQAMPAIAGGVSTQVYRRRDVGGFRHR